MALSVDSATLLFITSCVAGVIALTLTSIKKPRYPLPPGPTRIPFIGNVLQMPTEKAWLTFAEWGARWGNVVSVSLLGQPMIIINSHEDATELMDTRSSKYSDRPVLQMGGELIGWSKVLVLVRYGDQFRRMRKEIHKVLGTMQILSKHFRALEDETRVFLKHVNDDPESVERHIRRTAAAIILRLTYGYRISDNGVDPLVKLANDVTGHFSMSVVPGAFLVDVFPFLRHIPEWFPGAGFKRKAKAWKREFLKMVNIPVEYVKKDMASGNANESFIGSLLEDSDGTDGQEERIKYIGFSLYAGGADTVVASIHSFVLAMTLHPEVMKKAQAEIDLIVGFDRLPSFDDRPNLPYINALVLEVFRWHTPAPLGMYHRLTEDDIYKGHLIPAGSFVMANVWQLLHDPLVYTDPFVFNPERFLGANPEPDPTNMYFGFGRRICPARALADASVFISCAMTLAVFNITKAVEGGKEVAPVYDQTSGIVSHPKSFKCNITPRSDKAQRLFLLPVPI